MAEAKAEAEAAEAARQAQATHEKQLRHVAKIKKRLRKGEVTDPDEQIRLLDEVGEHAKANELRMREAKRADMRARAKEKALKPAVRGAIRPVCGEVRGVGRRGGVWRGCARALTYPETSRSRSHRT